MRGGRLVIPALLLLAVLASRASPILAQADGLSGGTLTERYQRAQEMLEEGRRKEALTRAERDRLKAEAEDLQRRLIATAARIQDLEAAHARVEAERLALNETMDGLKAQLDRERDRVAHLLAVLQRLHAVAPPALALKPDDSLAAARGAMLMGAMLPPLYRQAAAVAEKLKALSETQAAIAAKEAESEAGLQALKAARVDLDRLLEQKNADRAAAEEKLAELKGIMGEIGRQARDLKSLIDRIAALRQAGQASSGMTVVSPGRASTTTLSLGSLRAPVVGRAMPGDPAGPGRTPGARGPLGLWFEAPGGAEAVAPGDSEVVFAGNYQKFGPVLILEFPGGYHLTLAGLGRIDVQVGDLVLAGEPVGVLPEGPGARLYMELRHNGQAIDPAPWLDAELRKAKGT